MRVEEAPERQAKRSYFWRAVDALKALVPESSFIKEPATFCLHHAESCDIIGRASEVGFTWEDESMRKHFETLDLAELKKACLKRIS